MFFIAWGGGRNTARDAPPIFNPPTGHFEFFVHDVPLISSLNHSVPWKLFILLFDSSEREQRENGTKQRSTELFTGVVERGNLGRRHLNIVVNSFKRETLMNISSRNKFHLIPHNFIKNWYSDRINALGKSQ